MQSVDNIENDIEKAISHHASRLAKKSETKDAYFDLIALTKSYKILKDTKTDPLDKISEAQLQELFISAVQVMPIEAKKKILQLLLEDPDIKLLTEGQDGI